MLVPGTCGLGTCPTGFECRVNVFLCSCKPVPTYCCQSFTPPAPASVCVNWTPSRCPGGATYANDPLCCGACPPPACPAGSSCTADQATCTTNYDGNWTQTGCDGVPTNGCCLHHPVTQCSGVSCQSVTSCTGTCQIGMYNCLDPLFPPPRDADTCCCVPPPLPPPPDPCTTPPGISCPFGPSVCPPACPRCNSTTVKCVP